LGGEIRGFLGYEVAHLFVLLGRVSEINTRV